MTYTPVSGTAPMILDYATAVPDINIASGESSFTDVFKSQKSDVSKTDLVEGAKTSDDKNAKDVLTQTKPGKGIKTSNDKTEGESKVKELSIDDEEAIAEEVTEAVSNVIAEIAKEFGMDEEEILKIIEDLGMNLMDIMVPENLTQVVLTAAGEDRMALVTDENLGNFVNELVANLDEVVSNIETEYGITNDEVIEITKDSKTENFEEVLTNADEKLENPDDEIKVTFEVSKDKEPKATKEESKPLNEETSVQKENFVSKTGESAEKEPSHEKSSHGDSEPKENLLLQNIAQKVTETIQETTNETFTYAETRQVMNQIVETIHVSVKPETSDIEMLLNPESLGTVNVHLSSKEGVVTATFVTQNETVKNILEAQMIELKETFENQGVKVENIEVSVQTNAFAEEYENSRERNSSDGETKGKRTGIRRINLDSLEESEELTEEDSLAVTMMEANGGTVDYKA